MIVGEVLRHIVVLVVLRGFVIFRRAEQRTEGIEVERMRSHSSTCKKLGKPSRYGTGAASAMSNKREKCEVKRQGEHRSLAKMLTKPDLCLGIRNSPEDPRGYEVDLGDVDKRVAVESAARPTKSGAGEVDVNRWGDRSPMCGRVLLGDRFSSSETTQDRTCSGLPLTRMGESVGG